jgi:hypothetical protein
MPFTVTGGKYALQTLTAVGTNTITVNAAVPFWGGDFTSVQRIAALYTPAGSTVVTNGDFATDTDWTKGGGVTISGGAANATSASTIVSQNIAFTVGQQYLVSIQYTRTSGTSLRFSNSMTDGTNVVETVATVNTATLTTITFAFRAVASGFTIAAAGSAFTGTIDNVSILVGASLKGIAYARRATSTTVLELESEFFDPVDGSLKTQAVGDNILISKNWAECAVAGWSVSGVTTNITDRATIGISGNEASACIYDESKIMISGLTSGSLPPIIGAGGVWVQGHLQNWATQEMYGSCDFQHFNSGASLGGLHPQSLGFHYVVFGGKRVSVTGQIAWEPCRDANTISRAKTLVWMKVDAQAGILGPGDGSAPFFPGTESRMCFFSCTSEILTGYNICWRPCNAVVQGGSAKITASGALAVFGSGYNGFAIGAASGERFVVSDVRSGGFWDQFYGNTSLANFTNLLTPITTVARPSGAVTFNFNFKSAYQNLGIGSLIQILKADGTTTETSITTTTANTDLTVLARTISGTGANPPTIYNNANWTYAIWRYGSLPLSGAFAQSSYSLGTAGNALDVVHGGFFNQLADLSITQPNAATVAAYTTLETLDKIYDYSMHWKAASNSNMKAFGIGNQICKANGPILDFGNLNLHLDQNAETAFAANTTTNTVTIKASVLAAGMKFTSLKTTGAVTFANGASISATYTDSGGTRVLIRSADDGVELSTFIIKNGTPIGWLAEQATRALSVQPTDNIVASVIAYGFKQKVITTTGAGLAQNATIALNPETLVNTGLNTTTRDTIVSAFASGVDGLGRVYITIDRDLRQYSPAEVINALHYFLVTQGSDAAAGAAFAGTTDLFEIADGGFILRSTGLYSKVAESVLTDTDMGIYLPLQIYVDPSVYAMDPTFTPVKKNGAGVVLGVALWTKQAASVTPQDQAGIAAEVWKAPDRTLNGALFA